MKEKKIDHSNPCVIITDGDTRYDKGFYISSSPVLDETECNISFSAPMVHENRIMILANNMDSGYLAIDVETRKRLAAWLLEGL